MKKGICLLLLLGAFFYGEVDAQVYSDVNKMMNSSKKNFGKFNVLAGVNSSSLMFDSGLGQGVKASFPNVYGYYIGGNTYSSFAEKDNSFWSTSTDFIFGKQSINSPVNSVRIPDSVSVFNFDKYSGYLFKVPFKLIYNQRMGASSYWGLSVGALLEAPLLLGKLRTGETVKDLSSVYGQYLAGFGWTTGLELGFRSGFLAMEYSHGLGNYDNEDNGADIRNNGSLSLSIGIRFETEQGKKDAKIINSLRGK